MKRIYKYSLNTHFEQKIDLPKDATILSIQQQGSGVGLWALVNPDAPFIPTSFYAFTTGMSIEEELIKDLHYLDTVLLQNGSFVLHYFIKV